VDKFTSLLSRTPSKHCVLDPLLTWLLKRASDVLAPVLSEICNASLQSGNHADAHKSALVFPRFKKPTGDVQNTNYY